MDRLGSSGTIQCAAENAADDSGRVLHPPASELSSQSSLYERRYGFSSTHRPCSEVLVDLMISCGHESLGSPQTLQHLYQKQLLFFLLWPWSSLNNFIVPSTSGSSVRSSIILPGTDHGTVSQVLEMLLLGRLLSNGCAIAGSSLSLCTPQFLMM